MADRYWVGGAGNWSSTTKWSTTSGGASGASVPTSVDDVIFDANSGGKFTATVDTAQSVNSITITPSAAVGVQQIALSARLTTNNLTTTGTAGNNRIWFRGNTYGIAQDFVVNGTVSISDCDFRDIYVIGTAAPISGTRIGDLRGIRGITASTPKTVYWNLAGTQNWSANGWATTSTGTPSTDNFPLAQDIAAFTNAGSVTGAITMDAAIPYTGTVDMSGRTSAMTLNLGTALTIYGNWTNGSGTTIGGSNTVTFSGRNIQTKTSAGKTFPGGLVVDTYGGTVELADALTVSSASITVTNGTFDTKNFNVTTVSLSSANSNVRTITLGSSTVTLNGSSPINFGTDTNLTLNAGTSTFTLSAASAILNGGPVGRTFYNVNFTGTTNPTINQGANIFNNLTLTAPASAGLCVFALSANQTITGTFTVAGATAVRRIFVRSDSLGTTRTLTVNSLSAQDCDFRDITIAGAAAGSSPTRAGNCGGNTGITFPAAKTVYWNLAGSQVWGATAWAASSGGSPDINNYPLPQDTAVLDDAGSITGTITITSGAYQIGTLNMSGRTSAATLAVNTVSVYGNFTFGSGITTSGTQVITFAGRGTQTITSAGKSFTNDITIDSFSGTVQIADALVIASARTLNFLSGTFDAVTYNVTTGNFSANGGALPSTLRMGSGTWTLTASGLTPWNMSASNFTLYKGTANISMAIGNQFSGGSLSYNKLTLTGSAAGQTSFITGNNQFTELASTVTIAHTIGLSANQTFGAWTVTGTAGNVVTVTGTSAITIAGAAVSGVDYLALGTTIVSPTSPGEFYAGANSTGSGTAPLYRTAKPADSTRYWVGGTGNWSSTTKWSASSGGASGASVPRSHDDVVFNSASNATAYTATVDAVTGGIRCKALTIAGPASGNVTLAGSTAIVGIHGNVTLPATGLTRSYTGAITLSGSSTGRTLTTNGVAMANNIFINGVGCEWVLGSALNDGNGADLFLTNGSITCGVYNFTARSISSDNGNSRTINFGSGTMSLSGNTPINLGTTEANRAPLTVTAGTAQVNFTSTSPTFSGNNQTFYNVAFTSTSAGTATINGVNTFNNLSFTGITTAGLKNVSVTADQTINGTLTLSAGTNATMRTFVQSNTIGTTRTLTCAAVSATDADFRDITIAGAAAPVSGTRLGDCKGNSGITFDAAKTVYWKSATTSNWGANNWASSDAGSTDLAQFPLAQDTAVFLTFPNSGQQVTLNAAYNIGTIDMSARTGNTMTLSTSANTPTIYGNWINGTGTTLSGTGQMTFAGRGSQTITSAGKTFTQGVTINSPSGSVTLQDALTNSLVASNAFQVLSGAFDANGYNVSTTAGGIQSTGANTRTISFGSGTWTIAAAAGWTYSGSGLTVTGTGTISLTSASAKTFAGGGISYSGITLNQGGAGTLTITGNNTFANISNTYKATGATNITMGTTTQTVGNFTASGETGRVLTVQGTSAASPATLVFTGAAKPNVDYLTITGVRAYNLTDTWYAGTNSTNNGSLGWYFQSGTVATSTVYYGAVNVTVLYYGGTPVNSMYYGSVKVF